jgi:hypothetical protein
MSPSQWGPPVWDLLHTIAEKINENCFPDTSLQLFQIITQICKNLPCPDCTSHAGEFLKTVKMHTIQTKQDFKMMLFVFHNMVNARKKKPIFEVANLDKYAKNNLHTCFITFVAEYTKRQGNFKLMSDTSNRKRIAQSIGIWFNQNYSKFI